MQFTRIHPLPRQRSGHRDSIHDLHGAEHSSEGYGVAIDWRMYLIIFISEAKPRVGSRNLTLLWSPPAWLSRITRQVPSQFPP